LPRIVDSRALLGGGPLAIRHGDAIYYLRATRFGKLILTK
jgi:hemin uptake protein HemP